MTFTNKEKLVLAIIGAVLLIYILFRAVISSGELAASALDAYKRGEAAKTVAERKEAFNTALNEFLQIEKEGSPTFGTGRLYYDIGNAYFQLEDYPKAILYYSRAESLMPANDLLIHNLALARAKAGVTQKNKGWLNTFLLDSWLPLPRRLQLFSFFAATAILLASLWIWSGRRWLLRCAIVSAILLAAVAANLVATRYLAPIEAVVTTASFLRTDAGTAYAKVDEKPLSPGLGVEVLSLSQDQQWAKIAMPDGTFGFVPTASIELIR